MEKNFKSIFAVAAVASFLVMNLVFGVLLVGAVRGIRLYGGGASFRVDYVQLAEAFYARQDRLFEQPSVTYSMNSTYEDIYIDEYSIEQVTTNYITDFTVMAIPLEFHRGMTAMLTVQNETVPMEFNNGLLVGRLASTLELRDSWVVNYHITLYYDGVYRSEAFVYVVGR